MDDIFLSSRLVFGWIVLYMSFYGWGDILNRLLTHFFDFKAVLRSLEKFFLGFLFVTVILQIVHLVLPINFNVSATLFALGVVVFLFDFIKNKKYLSVVEFIKREWLLLVILLPFIILIVNLAFSTALVYDFGLYYRQTVKWIELQSIVPGLANIHSRFGFNNSTFLTASLLDSLKLIPQGFRILSSGMILYTLIYSISNLKELFSLKKTSLYGYYWALLLPFIMYIIFNGRGVYFISASPDTFVSILQIIVFGYLLRIFEEKSVKKETLMLILLYSVFLCTIKVSSAVFAVGTVFAALQVTFLQGHLKQILTLKFLMYSLLVSVLIGGIWITRSIIISGYALYPLSSISFDMDWKVPVEIVDNESDWIKSWAKTPRARPEEVLENWNWLGGWIERNFTDSRITPLLIYSATFLGLSLTRFRKNYQFFIILLPSLLGLLFWFVTAPDPRFALSTFWILLVTTILLFSNVFELDNIKRTILLVLMFVLVTGTREIQSYHTENLRDNLAYKDIECRYIETSSGDSICLPKTGDQCWDTPLICTPYEYHGILVDRDEGGHIKMIRSEKINE